MVPKRDEHRDPTRREVCREFLFVGGGAEGAGLQLHAAQLPVGARPGAEHLPRRQHLRGGAVKGGGGEMAAAVRVRGEDGRLDPPELPLQPRVGKEVGRSRAVRRVLLQQPLDGPGHERAVPALRERGGAALYDLVDQ